MFEKHKNWMKDEGLFNELASGKYTYTRPPQPPTTTPQ